MRGDARHHVASIVELTDAPSFGDFYRGEWNDAYRLASLLTQSADAGEEIAQDALSRTWAAWERIDQPRAYLRRSIVNASHNSHRRARVRREKLPLVSRPEAVAADLDELADAIARLPFRQRAVVVLRFWADLPEIEIARVLGCRPGTVKSLSSRALHTLEKEIER